MCQPCTPAGPSRPPERRDALEAGEALVVALGLRDAPLVVLLEAVQLAQRDARVQVAEVELVAGLEHVVGARALLLVALPGVAREAVQAQRGDARRELPRRRSVSMPPSPAARFLLA